MEIFISSQTKARSKLLEVQSKLKFLRGKPDRKLFALTVTLGEKTFRQLSFHNYIFSNNYLGITDS